ncbi:DeoR/GlpR transcriptional regulator (plasmid) [Agrobacterium tumefaciens]|uniref:Transcriptional regulator of sugar metabolism n=3 Tax=Rhizobiaceae TaxID=82115 RepID=A0A2Z2PIG1_AGRTU|nr:DeoR/GlpR family DNA-binding transcription regulator [Agrobacterium fabrum]ASK41015.1 transcriptional regulator of sugar metabolism [Rhizobium rhizogenes]ASK41185.1 transcriptional regulator of sugar metabolism [Agrobacterium tumefaciens]ASK41820.1 transcriptional regulator of sugar metabolism [Agrobacterium tumefaciens]NSZ87734.1 DeoR/GlpR transcriptional regulator [Agrobacterium tumefaciens]NTI46529.1 DeoR/GlpR transcriptional regulator [Rhizobium rhizogenes]
MAVRTARTRLNDKNVAQDDDFLPAERRSKILDWFSTNSVASTQDLARRLNASISTIRRDLDSLAADGLLKRTHGGAVRVRQNTTYEQRMEEARNTSVEEKRAIAKAAASILQPGQSVLIDSKSTSHLLAHAIAELAIPLTVITNDVQVAAILANRDPISVVVPGGTCRHGAYVLLGETSTKFVRELNCDHYFLCTHAVDPSGPTDTWLDLVQLQRAMVGAAIETTLIIDSSKFGSRKIYSVVPMKQIKRIITDEGLPQDDRDRYSALVDELVIAPFLEESPSEQEV